MYTRVINLLTQNFMKGSYCLARLSQMQDETIMYEAYDALFALISCEESQLAQLNIFFTDINSFILKSPFSFARKLKGLLASFVKQTVL